MPGLILLVPAVLIGLAGPAEAHAAAHAGPEGWIFEPWVVTSLMLSIAAYAAGVGRAHTRSGSSRVFGRIEIAAFAAGIVSLFVALESPIDTIGAELFSVHMVQHLMLMLLIAPFFVFARPLLAFFWALPRPARRSLGRWWTGAPATVFGYLNHPLSVWIWFCGLFVFWHLPRPYGWALASEPIHVLEHLSFFVSAYAFWSVVIEPSGRRRLGYGATLIFLCTATILSGLPGALLILTERPLYPEHAAGVARWGMTLVEDQQLAGLLMWIPAGFVYLAAISIVFVLWLRDAEKRAVRLDRLGRFAPLMLVILVALAGCERSADATGVMKVAGDARAGKATIESIGCGTCHTIPGVPGADGLVGPPLNHMKHRVFIAGMLRNTPSNLVTWITDPQSVVPGNAMPDMGVTPEQAQDIAAYLYTLE